MADAQAARPERLTYFDGLRGLGALAIVLAHIHIAMLFFADAVVLPRWLNRVIGLFSSMGQARLDMFIVLSGYGLSIPIARSGGVLRGGTLGYLRRRAERILIPYYGALLLALALIWLCRTVPLTPVAAEHTAPEAIVTHFLLVHNWWESWSRTLNPSLWSLALEWNIYFFLPLVLLPVWRRLGIAAAVLVAFGIGLAPGWLGDGWLHWSSPWLLGLFALGMAGAWVSYSTEPAAVALKARVPWGWVALGVWAPITAVCLLFKGFYHAHEVLADSLIGVAIAALLIHCQRAGAASLAVKVLDHRLPRWLGKFSYSLFLTHYPVLACVWALQARFAMAPAARAAFMYTLGLGIILAVAFLFYLAVEAPSLRWARRGRERARAAERTVPVAA